MKKKIVICSHAVFVGKKDVFGPGHAISDFLNLYKIPHIYIKHSLYDARESIVEINQNKIKKISTLLLPRYFPSLLRYLVEMISVIYFIAKKKKLHLFIGINPLNAFAGIIAKKVGLVDIVIFYTADYAFNRFDNGLLNKLYHFLDKFAIKNADCVWNVSSRIREVRKNQGVDDHRNIFVPNAPMLRPLTHFKGGKKNRKGLVLMANFTPAIDYDLIIKVVATLKKKYSDISLSLIGTGVREAEIKKLVKKLKLDTAVHFLGHMEHDNALREIAKNTIGLAPYSSNWSWTAFGDSLKAREYLAFGLPVIMNRGISTGDDIARFQAGFVINLNKKELIKALEELISNDKVYNAMKRNAIKMAKEFDLEQILKKQLLQKYHI